MKTFNPKEYFQTRDGLYIWNIFLERMNLNPIKPQGIKKISHFELKKNAFDKDIEQVPCTLDQIATIINKQSNGEFGELLTNGFSNLFYVYGKDNQLFVVDVHWFAGHREWRVHAWELDEFGRWDAGRRVFRNSTSKLSTIALDTLPLDLPNELVINGIKYKRQ